MNPEIEFSTQHSGGVGMKSNCYHISKSRERSLVAPPEFATGLFVLMPSAGGMEENVGVRRCLTAALSGVGSSGMRTISSPGGGSGR